MIFAENLKLSCTDADKASRWISFKLLTYQSPSHLSDQSVTSYFSTWKVPSYFYTSSNLTLCISQPVQHLLLTSSCSFFHFLLPCNKSPAKKSSQSDFAKPFVVCAPLLPHAVSFSVVREFPTSFQYKTLLIQFPFLSLLISIT